MGASRKLQGEIDRVLKKVQEGVEVFDSIWNKVYDTDNANQKEKFEADLKKEIKKLQRYRDQIKTWIQSSEIKDKKALLDARKQIEREMERFKVCEKETKTKAFSKEGLGQQPKTDPRDKAKSETRDWINNLVTELESQIDSFEAEIEGLSVKKGKTRPPRLIHLETSIARHKAHIMKLELILRLLDNDELSPEQVNDVREFLEDYIERNQMNFDEFKEVDHLYESLPLEKVEALEELVAVGPPGLVKGSGATSSVLSSKTPLAPSSPTPAAVTSSHLTASLQEPIEETVSQDTNFDAGQRIPPVKTNLVDASNMTIPPGTLTTTVPINVSARASLSSSASAITPGPFSARVVSESAGSVISSPLNLSVAPKEEENVNIPAQKSSPSLADAGVVKGIARTSHAAAAIPTSLGAVPSSGMTLGTVQLTSEAVKRNILAADERLASTVVAGRAFSSVGPGVQWRPGNSFQNQNEIRGRPEIAPDQREKFLQRLQQVQQQGHSNVLGMPTLGSGNENQYSGIHNSLLPQLNSQSSSLSSQAGLGLGVQASGHNTSMPMSLQQPSSIHQQAALQGAIINGPKDADIGFNISEEQLQQNLDDPTSEAVPGSTIVKNLMNDDDMKDVPTRDVSSPLIESIQLQRDADLSPGLPLQSSQSSAGLGVIGRRSGSDLGAISDTISGASPNSGVMYDQAYYLQMLQSAYMKLPQPKDSEHIKSFVPRHPTVTPSYYPQVQAPVVNSPVFWEHVGRDPSKTDVLFFAFYHQQNTYQQYMAARELKKLSWRYHRKYNTWFQRHEEPKISTDEYEKGAYVYFDFHASNDQQPQGWCQRIKQDFQFDYNFLEDELII